MFRFYSFRSAFIFIDGKVGKQGTIEFRSGSSTEGLFLDFVF